ncbi:hypothetical protein JCM8097_009565 [Rhodosporidiobolus ruineniae]
MSTFSRKSFDAVAYAASRPSYPPALFTHVLSSTLPSSPPAAPRTLLDLGCGPGVSTFDWAPHLLPSHFNRVVGIDPSERMVTTARQILEDKRNKGELGEAGEKGKVDWRFEVARSDDLQGVVEDASVDLAIAGQAAHWFDAPATYKELARVLKPGGAFAFWGYGEMFFPQRPELTQLVPQYSAGTLGPYWEQPGRSIVEALLTPVPFPSSASPLSAAAPIAPQSSAAPVSAALKGHSAPSSSASAGEAAFDPKSFRRSFFLRPGGVPPPLAQAATQAPPQASPSSSNGSAAPSPADHSRLPYRQRSSSSPPGPFDPSQHLEVNPSLLLTRSWTLTDLSAYLRTWSAAHTFNEQHASGSAKGGEEATGRVATDCVEVFCKRLKAMGWGEGERVEVAWEVGVMVGRKKGGEGEEEA